jgi:lipopolysaccharide export system ATP-binding protein
MPNLLEIDSVIKNYGSTRILSDIYLRCQTGDVIGLIGRNGTGKSTLLKIFFGTENALNRFIRIDGKHYNKPFLQKGEIAYLPQDSFLLSQLTVIKTIDVFLGRDYIPLFGQDKMLEKLMNSKISMLSGGELRYLEIKLLLNLPAKFLLLDEPFNGVAPVIVDKLKVMIGRHALTKGIILSDHDYRNILDVSTQCFILYQGSLKAIARLDDLYRWGYIPPSHLEE